MHIEVSIAVNYILSHLYTKLPRRRVDSFGEELEKYLHVKFQHHWFPADPARDAAFRCLNIVGPHVDLLLPEAAAVSGLDWSEIQACLPDGLILSIDPGHVACQFQQSNNSNNNQPDLTRFKTAPFWSANSVSLSSSGCSSASSSISSTNLSPSAGQLTQQVLYNLQDNCVANQGSLWPDSLLGNMAMARQLKCEVDHGDNLATATALSVLADYEEHNASTLGLEQGKFQKNELGKLQNPWIRDRAQLDSYELNANYNLRELGCKTLDSSKLELSNVTEGSVFQSPAWGLPESDTEKNLLSMLHAELSGISDSVPQTTFTSDKTQLTNRSASNPPQTDHQNYSNMNEFIPISNAPGCLNAMPPKIDQPLLQMLNHTPQSITGSIPQRFPSTTVNPFVQKSTSTPSFTAATFAQTKFGSTKLKSHSKRTPNRMISPTMITPKISSLNGPGGLPRESVVATVLGTNQQRPTQGMNTDFNAFRQHVQLPVDIHQVFNKQSNMTEMVANPDSTSTKGVDQLATNGVVDPLVPMRFGVPIQNANATSLDEYFSGPLEGSNHEAIQEKQGFLSNGINPMNLWSYPPMKSQIDLNFGQLDGVVNGNDWTPSTIMANLEYEKSNSLFLAGRGSRKEEHFGSTNDGSLSTRMLKLLLDEDTMNSESPREQAYSQITDTPPTAMNGSDRSALQHLLDHINPITSSADSIAIGDGLLGSAKTD